MLESGLLGLFGCAFGALAASALAAGLNAAAIPVPEAVQLFLSQEHLTFQLEAGAAVSDVLLLTLVTVGASLGPALRAARLKPITAMHQIG